MKKHVFLFWVLVCASSLSAQVAFLQRVANVTDYPSEIDNDVAQQPERNAYDWFSANFVEQGKGAVISMTDVLTLSPENYNVLWVNLSSVEVASLADAGFSNKVIAAIKTYVENGGNLLLTSQATHIAYRIGRINYAPNEGSMSHAGYGDGNDIWSISPYIGYDMGVNKSDQSRHPVFDGLETVNSYGYDTYPLIGGVRRTNNNNNWEPMKRIDGTTVQGNTEGDKLANFQADWHCAVLATWGHVRDFCAPGIIEFYPYGDFKGRIIACGVQSYQWGSNNTAYIANVRRLTNNMLDYLGHDGVEYGYVLPYTLAALYSVETQRPDYNAAMWFYNNYVTTNQGRFLHKNETIPSGMKVLWVNNDRNNQTNEAFYSDFGGNDFRDRLKTFVQAGGRLFLTKQAVRFVSDIDRAAWAPNYDNKSDYFDGSDTWYMVADFKTVGSGVDRHTHPAFQYMENYTGHNSEGYCKWPFVSGEGTYKRTDHKYMWGEPGNVWSDTYGISAGTTSIDRLEAFETAMTAHILGGWGHTTALDGATMVEFRPTDDYEGTVIVMGLAAYQWTTANTCSNVQNLTKGVLEYLYDVDNYARDLTSGYYGTICLPRDAASYEGVTLFRIVDKTAEDGIVIEETDDMQAGVPYIFYPSASTLRVHMTGGVQDAQRANGLVGYIGFTPLTLTPDDNHYILAYNKIWQVDESIDVPSNRAYIDLTAVSPIAPAAGKRRYVIHGNHTTTAMDACSDENVTEKRMENGVLYIYKNGIRYNMQGQELK